MKKVNRKVLYPVKHNSVLYLTSGDDKCKTSSSQFKYLIDYKLIGTNLSCLSLQNEIDIII